MTPVYNFQQLAFGRHWHYRSMRRLPVTLLMKAMIGRESFRDLQWILRYCFRLGAKGTSLKWYSSLFINTENLISGDKSPIYYRLPEVKVSDFSRFYPSTKVMIFVRNPIDRVWSMAQKTVARGGKRKLEEIPLKEFVNHFDYVFAHWIPYKMVIDLWKRNFQQVYVGQFDDLKENPTSFFCEICDFLEINKSVKIDNIGEKVNKGIGDRIPVVLADHLRKQYRDEIKSLTVQGYCKNPEAWLGPRMGEDATLEEPG